MRRSIDLPLRHWGASEESYIKTLHFLSNLAFSACNIVSIRVDHSKKWYNSLFSVKGNRLQLCQPRGLCSSSITPLASGSTWRLGREVKNKSHQRGSLTGKSSQDTLIFNILQWNLLHNFYTEKFDSFCVFLLRNNLNKIYYYKERVKPF